ncbi:MAG: hypothetical protein H0V26_03715 [Solirubrobacterales bacterium]|nr:hypothetical protein [Solirubrobacterales bacterium]
MSDRLPALALGHGLEVMAVALGERRDGGGDRRLCEEFVGSGGHMASMAVDVRRSPASGTNCR